MSIILIGQSSPCSLGEAICSLFVSATHTCMDAGCQFIYSATPLHSFVLLNNTVFYHLQSDMALSPRCTMDHLRNALLLIGFRRPRLDRTRVLDYIF